MALYLAKVGDHTLARESISHVLAQDHIAPVQFYRATVMFEILGDRDVALDMLERAISTGYPMGEILGDPELEGLAKTCDLHF